jgi:serine protease SohB
MDFLYETLAFAAKAFVVFLTIAASTGVVASLLRRRRTNSNAHLEVKPLNRRFQALGDALRQSLLDRKALKALGKTRKQEASKPPSDEAKPNVYVLDFDGDVLATAVTSLREEVSAISAVARPNDEVVVRLESPGGGVPHYGLAAAQLQRLKDKKVKLTVCVDRVAASGGYMMACVADRIVAAPFAIVGSIGVVAQVPNVHRLLKKHDVDFEEMTAGEFKRTVSVFGEITEKGRAKFTEQLEETHSLFKAFVKSQRPALDLQQVATGEYWLARRGLELGLVDQLATSDEYLLGRAAEANLFQLNYRPEAAWRQRFGRFAAEVVERAVVTVLTRVQALGLR